MRVGAGELERASWWESILSSEEGSVKSVSITPDLDAAGATSRIDRVTITLRRSSRGDTSAPRPAAVTETRRYVVKSSGDSFRGTGRRLPQWRTEKSFYDHVAPHAGVRTPTCLWSVASESGDAGMLILEDVAATGADLDPLRTADLADALTAYAALHATPERHGRHLPRHSYLMADAIPAVWDTLRSEVARRRPDAVEMYDSVFARYPRLLEWVRRRDATIAHGDATARNVLRCADDSRGGLALVDFGTATLGIPTIDIARLASETEEGAGSRAAHRAAWELWMQRLSEHGRPPLSQWPDYLAGLALCAQFGMFQEVPPWDSGTRHDSYLRGARLLESALRECEVVRFLDELPS